MAKYASAGGSLEGHASVGTIDSKKLQLVSGSLNIATRGGDPAKAVELGEGGWSYWVDSIKGNPAFLGFDKDNGLMPIWRLAATEARQESILRAYRIRAAKALRTTIISYTSANPEPQPAAYVKVPDGYKLVSGGARVNCHGAGNFLTASFPDGNNVWRARAKHHEVTDHATITVYAVAIYDPDDIWDVRLWSAGPSFKGSMQKAEGPVRSGYVIVGGGAQVDYGDQAGNLLYVSQPYQDEADGGRWKWIGQMKDQETASPRATITAYALGLKPNVPGIKVEFKIKNSPRSVSATKVEEDASPESQYVMTGGGASLRWSDYSEIPVRELNRGLELTGSYPKDRSTWQGQGKDQPRHPTQGSIEVYAIGVKVVDA
jgi:hypothetical protein